MSAVKIVLALFCVAGVSARGWAQSTTRSNDAASELSFRWGDEISLGDLNDPLGFWGFVGASSGFLNYNNVDDTINGPQLNVKAVGSYYTLDRRWILNTALGLHTGQVDIGRQNEGVNAALLEFSGHYRITPKWHAGPALNFLVGNGRDYDSGSRAVTTFAGAAAYRDFHAETHILRLGGRLMTDVGIPGKVATLAMIDVQLSLPLQRYAKRDYAYYNQPPAAAPATESAAAEPATTRQPAAVVPMENWPLRYEMGSALPAREDAEFLRRLGERLAQNEDLFEEVRIFGHADKRGTSDTNRILSSARAQTIVRTFAQSGVPAHKLRTYAFGASQPLVEGNTPSAFTLNRRVEIQFIGVKDEAQLNQILESVSR